MKIVHTLIYIILISTATLGNDFGLSKNKFINKNFNTQEINDLELILAFFDQVVLNKTGIKNMQIAYPKYINITINDTTYRQQPDVFFSQFGIDSIGQKDLYQEISDQTKYKIWCLCQRFEKGGEKYLQIYWEGNYAKVIKKNRKEHHYYKSYNRILKMALGTTPSMIMDFGYYVDEINYGKEINRLILAIHILTLNALELRIK